jgi:NitT/TauT family transport system permease protein/taurine transport system permease protein
LGFMIFNAQQYLESDVVIMGMICLGVLWLLIDAVVLVPMVRLTSEKWGTMS